MSLYRPGRDATFNRLIEQLAQLPMQRALEDFIVNFGPGAVVELNPTEGPLSALGVAVVLTFKDMRDPLKKLKLT